jgi:hypothetical protein
VRVQEEISAANLQPIDKSMLVRQKQQSVEAGELVMYDNSAYFIFAAKNVLPQ